MGMVYKAMDMRLDRIVAKKAGNKDNFGITRCANQKSVEGTISQEAGKPAGCPDPQVCRLLVGAPASIFKPARPHRPSHHSGNLSCFGSGSQKLAIKPTA
jgi:hypothetical protein